MTDVSVSQPTPEEPTSAELRGRINLALSLLEHRGEGTPLEQLVIEALLGATISDLLDVARIHGSLDEYFASGR